MPHSANLPLFAERDVSRTDRNNKFYEGSENPGLVLLNDVLMTYCMYNFDLGEDLVGGRGGGENGTSPNCQGPLGSLA